MPPRATGCKPSWPALQLQRFNYSSSASLRRFGHLEEATDDWNNPTAATKSVHLTMGFGGTDPATCAPVLGRFEVCNAAYGDNGWLGLAQVWVYRGKDKHIAQATALLNDTYYADGSSYDSYGWRQLVVCQEIAHDFGLDHQDENFSNPNLGTCMDYTAAPGGGGTFGSLENTHPNQHDYDQLATLYAHLAGGGSSGGCWWRWWWARSRGRTTRGPAPSPSGSGPSTCAHRYTRSLGPIDSQQWALLPLRIGSGQRVGALHVRDLGVVTLAAHRRDGIGTTGASNCRTKPTRTFSTVT
jgi:hypothetical protein